ncbi:hypothetical protein [Nonomuraea sp. NPDC023979]|uniref:hypothetical protein n=1 Tax=unclassified Nonomuraea TaxID=2593643 RepID=UPI0033C27508
MIRDFALAALAGAALGTASPAQATDVPAYTCDNLRGDPATTVLYGSCEATPGAVTSGEFAGEVTGQTRQYAIRIRCTGGGRAALPGEVLMQDCTRVG